ncbi:hypothetical protein MTR67_023571 [Solanum verrucosum]|uniref:RNase H type-1 domain-containing protein n=1 Tax=Solanum verrucosum TaxID=315347 RepID=A0AAF0TRY8_SOLVR|nr:hypothetical protein MTR67_023571 [Solanum verrucosum]
MVYAFTIPLGYGTNNKVETLVAIHGIEWCIQHGYRRIILEIDSELLTRWLTHSLKPPGNCSKVSRTSSTSPGNWNFSVVSIFKEKQTI